MDVHERAWRICRRVARDVAGIAPRGIEAYDGVSRAVVRADADFLLALEAWAGNPRSAIARGRLRRARADVLGAWRLAAERFEAREARR